MKLSQMTSPSVAILGAYGLLVVCLVLLGYLTSGSDLAILIATGANSISVPVGGLLVILAASWQQLETEHGGKVERDDRPTRTDGDRAPLIDRSIVLVGNGYEQLSLDVSSDDLRIRTGAGEIRRDGSRPSDDEAKDPMQSPDQED